MNVLGHKDKRMEFIAALAAITIERFQEQTDVGLDNEQSSSLPCREGYEIGSGRGEESSRLQSKPQRLKAARFA